MRILIPLLGSFSKEGGWRVLSELANKWVDYGHEVTFLSHKRFKQPYFPTKANIIFYDNSGAISTQGDPNYPIPFGGPFPLRKILKKSLNRLTADVVLATHNFTADPIAKSSIKAHKFYYIQAYEPEYYDNGPLRYKVYKRIAINSYKKGLIPIVNAPMYKEYKEIKTDRVVLPGVDLENFYPKNNNVLRTEPFIFGSIGRTEIFKGTQYIIDAFKKARLIHGNKIELHLAFGDEKWNDIDGVKITFPKNDKELANYYRSLDCYVCAGYLQLDAVHYPVIEAMACHVPVITTGYYPSTENNSYKIKIKDVYSITEAISKVLENPDLALSRADVALEEIQQFDWNNVANKMLDYFLEI